MNYVLSSGSNWPVDLGAVLWAKLFRIISKKYSDLVQGYWNIFYQRSKIYSAFYEGVIGTLKGHSLIKFNSGYRALINLFQRITAFQSSDKRLIQNGGAVCFE